MSRKHFNTFGAWLAFWFFQIVFPRLIFFGVWSFCFYGVYRAVRG